MIVLRIRSELQDLLSAEHGRDRTAKREREREIPMGSKIGRERPRKKLWCRAGKCMLTTRVERDGGAFVLHKTILGITLKQLPPHIPSTPASVLIMGLSPVLLTGEDYELHGDARNLMVTAAVIFSVLVICEISSNKLAGIVFADDKAIMVPRIRKKLCRSVNEFLSMMFMAWLGYESFMEMGLFSPFTGGVGVDNVMHSPVMTFKQVKLC